jgi:hypothetical protein
MFATPLPLIARRRKAGGAAAPEFQSAEIGTVNGYTVVVTFDSDISASNYATGVTIKANNVSQTITSATRQANHAIVRYVIPIPYHGNGDTLTWEYDADTGNIEGESGGVPLADVTAQAVTNNIAWEALLDLQADTGVTETGGAVSAWADQSGNGNNFSQGTAGARPALQTVSSFLALVFDGTNDMLTGSNFAANLSSFTIIALAKTASNATVEIIIAKKEIYFSGPGWFLAGFVSDANFVWQNNSTSIDISNPSTNLSSAFHVITAQKDNNGAGSIYINGSSTGSVQEGESNANFGNSEIVTIGTVANESLDGDGFWQGSLRAILICSSAPNATDRAALETRLGARYGLTVP